MPRHHFAFRIALFCVFILPCTGILIAQEQVSQLDTAVTAKFVDLGTVSVPMLQPKYGYPTIGDYTIDTQGYSEIRFFVSVFAENYGATPIKDAKLNLRFFLNTQGGSWSYADCTVPSSSSSSVQAWTMQKIYGKSTRVWVWVENLPSAAPYRITASYYLLP